MSNVPAGNMSLASSESRLDQMVDKEEEVSVSLFSLSLKNFYYNVRINLCSFPARELNRKHKTFFFSEQEVSFYF